jgi:hypothetical protein
MQNRSAGTLRLHPPLGSGEMRAAGHRRDIGIVETGYLVWPGWLRFVVRRDGHLTAKVFVRAPIRTA